MPGRRVVLVDSSVWIALLRNRRGNGTDALRRLLPSRRASLSPQIYQEVLQGANSADHFTRLQEYFSTLPLLLPEHPVRSHEAAGHLYARCRWRGLTPRSPYDCMVAQTAIEHDVDLLAHDRDFDAIARVESRLRIYNHAS